MQPYQKAGLEEQRQGQIPFELAKKGASIASTAAGIYGAGSLTNRVLPLLNKFIPQSIAVKALSRLDKRFGGFINKALDGGFDFDEVKEFIKNKIESSEEKPAKQAGNIIEQYSPELHKFVDQEIRKGKTPVQAGADALKNKKFADIIKKMSNDHKISWSQIVDSVFGLEASRKNALGKFQEKKKRPSLIEEETQRFKEGYGQIQQPAEQQGQGPGQQALMDILRKIQQSRGQQ